MLERSRTQIYISQIPIVGIQSVLPDIQSSASHELALLSQCGSYHPSSIDNQTHLLIISTEGALKLPWTYDDHPIPTYSSEDDLSIEDLI